MSRAELIAQADREETAANKLRDAGDYAGYALLLGQSLTTRARARRQS